LLWLLAARKKKLLLRHPLRLKLLLRLPLRLLLRLTKLLLRLPLRPTKLLLRLPLRLTKPPLRLLLRLTKLPLRPHPSNQRLLGIKKGCPNGQPFYLLRRTSAASLPKPYGRR
jgi:hypothetical protein